MAPYDYLIVGGGMTADAAAQGIRGVDANGRIGLLDAEAPLRFAVIGGGFIGTEIAAALRMQGRDVTMLVPEDGLGARVFPADLARFLVDYYRQKGVELRMGEGMTGLEARAGKAVVRTTKNSQVTSDVIVAGLGIQPNVELAEQAGLRVDNRRVVDERGRTRRAGIYPPGRG